VLTEENIKKVECIDFPELGVEAGWKIEVVNFPAFIWWTTRARFDRSRASAAIGLANAAHSTASRGADRLR